MRERILKCGSGNALVGVLSEPERLDPSRPAIIVLNSGIVHRIGTCRFSVKAVRLLAELGLAGVRFDLSGIGDSDVRRDDKPFEESAPAEVQDVMNYVEKHRKVREFILMGLCSGADVAYETAKKDDRVVGIVQIDPYHYKDWRYYAHRFGPSMMSWTKWRNLLARVVTRQPPLPAAATDDDRELPEYMRVFPPQRDVEAGLRDLNARDVKILAFFTNGADHYSYSDQFRQNFGSIDFSDRLRVEFVPEADHMVTGLREQAQFLNILKEWVATHFATAEPHTDWDRNRSMTPEQSYTENGAPRALNASP